MSKRTTFICHNVQHLAKSHYYKSVLRKQSDSFEINLIWNLFTKAAEGSLIKDYDHVFSFVNSDKYNKFIMPFTQQGRWFSLAKLLPTYEDPDIEEEFYIFSDQMYFNIRLFDELDKIKNKKYSITLLDEGLGLYSENVEHYTLTPGKLFKLIAGVHIPKDSFIGWDPRVKKIIAQHPELLPEHKRKNRIIEQEPNIWGDMVFWSHWFQNNYGCQYDQPDKKVLYLGTVGFYLSYEKTIIRELNRIFSKELVVMKVHPRVSKAYIESIAEMIQIVDDPNLCELPAELLISFYKPDFLITLSSSAATNIAECFPNISTVFLYDIFENNKSISSLLKRYSDQFSNIICVHSFSELEELVQK